MEFQNTIAFAQYYSAGGEFTVASGSAYIPFPFSPSVVEEGEKNITKNGTTNFEIIVLQDGAYFVDFSFIADTGDAKIYTISTYKNGVEINAKSRLMFYQQTNDMKYEVSGTWILDLNQDDKLAFYLSGSGVPAEAFYTRDIKLSIFSLQQLGLH